jgi:hypothetical protein
LATLVLFSVLTYQAEQFDTLPEGRLEYCQFAVAQTQAGIFMIMDFIRQRLIRHRETIIAEILHVKGLMQIIMKQRNTGQKWTTEEIQEVRLHLKSLALAIPCIFIFILPGGSLFLPILAEVLDRRKIKRAKKIS